MSQSRHLSRRQFLRTGASLGAAALASPYVIPSGVLAADRPGANDRIGIGYIGAGRRAYQLMDLPSEAVVVGGADVDRKKAEKLAARYRSKAYQDYRRLLDSKDVDAVIIATPDHWHALPAIHACQAGKDVYIEKPMTLTIREGRVMVEAARKHKRMVQTGSQQRSMAANRYGCELIRNGRIGKVHTVIGANYPSPWRFEFPGQPVPQGLDWDAWCGPTEPVPFHQDIFVSRSNPGWISFEAYSGGEMTGWGAHGLDQVQWALGMDDSGPVEIWADGGPLDPPLYTRPEPRTRGDKLCSEGRKVHFRYASGTVLVLDNGPPGGAVFMGDKGKITLDRDKLIAEPDEIAHQPILPGELHLAQSDDHMRNWFDSIKSRQLPIADVEVGHRSATVCHLGNIARRLGRKLHWDPAREIFPGDDEANRFLDRPRRKPYSLPEAV